MKKYLQVLCVLAFVSFSSSSFANDGDYQAALLKAKDPEVQEFLNKATHLLDPEVIAIARKVYLCALQKGIKSKPIFTLVDFQLPSTKKRLWVVDLKNHKVLYHGLVAHGEGSGVTEARDFSNTPNSHQSSLGVYLTQGTYVGGNGYSLKLKGLEQGFNSNAISRYIVLHGAPYVSEDFIKRYGRLGRSWGCPAVSQRLVKPIINEIKNGSLLLIYQHNAKWLKDSTFVNCKLDAETKKAL